MAHPTAAAAGYTVAGSIIVGAGASLGLLAGLAALVAAGACLVGLRRPELGALLLVALVPASSGLRRGLPLPGLRLSEVLIAGLAVLLIATVRAGRSARWQAFDWIALAYVVLHAGLGFFSRFERGEVLDFLAVGELLGPLQFFLIYRAVVVALPEESQRRQALRLILLASVPVSTVAILQSLDFPGVRDFLSAVTEEAPGVDRFQKSVVEGLPRATGPFASWHALGGYLFLIILLGVGLMLDEARAVLSQRALALILLPATVALLLTVSFAPIAGAVVGSIVLGWWAGRGTAVTVGLAVVALAASFLFAPLFTGRYDQQFNAGTDTRLSPPVPQTLAYRYEVWTKQYLPVLSDRWATGYGADQPPEATWQSTESIYLTMLLRGGLPLFAAYLALMFALTAAALRWTRGPPPQRRVVARVLVVAVLGLALIQLVVPLFVGTGVPHVFWVLAAILFASGGPAAARVGARGGTLSRSASAVR
jgi:hypothetical protein